ncbi:protein FAM177A1-like, partial [Ylistrum balloti]|uniref:protein FAM177A1-like n=1 Tax=Ylistrum balloti TaxID=509963 RepID=UPI002905B549
KTLTWFPWVWYYTVLAASKTLKGADFCGEKLAWFFGITTPKYQYAIDEFYRLKEEEEKEKARQEKILRKLETEKLSSVDVEIDFKGIPSKHMPSANTSENMEKY